MQWVNLLGGCRSRAIRNRFLDRIKSHNNLFGIFVLDVRLFEKTTKLTAQEAYEKIKLFLAQEKGLTISEESPEHILVKQGSLWGISPKTAKKTIDISIQPTNLGTRVVYASKLASDWKNITLIGCIFAAILAGLCLWISTDLSALSVTHPSSTWSWLISNGGYVNSAAQIAFINLTREMAVFLVIIIVVEVAIVVYAKSKIHDYAAKDLAKLF